MPECKVGLNNKVHRKPSRGTQGLRIRGSEPSRTGQHVGKVYKWDARVQAGAERQGAGRELGQSVLKQRVRGMKWRSDQGRKTSMASLPA